MAGPPPPAGPAPDGTGLRRAVVLSTLGSLGDLYPVLSLARALERRRIEARLALAADDCVVAERWGLLATPIGPSEAEICDALGLGRDGIAASVLRDPSPMVSRALMPLLEDMARRSYALAPGAGCFAGTTFSLGSALAAEMAGLPYVPLLLQPAVLFSAEDPPSTAPFRFAAHPPTGRMGLAWNRVWMATARAVLRHRHGREMNDVRDALGLAPSHATPLIDHDAAVPFRLGLWPDAFAPPPEDVAEDIDLVGFPPAPRGELAPMIRSWIDAGSPPLVVTLGSIAHTLGPPDFWEQAVGMARRLGLRAILLHGEAEVPVADDVLGVGYAPHGPLFPLAAAVVHHGGIGTSAEALRSGRPQLVLPVGGDQPDNAARLERLGVAAAVPIRRFTAERGSTSLSNLLHGFDYSKSSALAKRIAGQDGAARAAARLASLVEG